MNEFIEVQFRKNGKRFRVKRQLSGGIEFDEPDPIERTIGVAFDARTAATRVRMESIRRIQGWDPGQFKLNVSVEDGALILRGVNEHALPPGLYKLRLQIEEAKTGGGFQSADIDDDGNAIVNIDITMDERNVQVDLTECDPIMRGVLERSQLDGVDAVDWIQDVNHRPTRQACLMNLLASLRTRPTLAAPLVAAVHQVFFVGNDRIYAKVDRALLDNMHALVKDPKKPFFAEGKPRAAIHGKLLSAIPELPEVRSRFKDLLSFRGEGKPSMQAVITMAPSDLSHTYAEFDLDLGNPLQDLLGFFVHVGELLDGKPTNHLDMHKQLTKTRAGEFLCYTVHEK